MKALPAWLEIPNPKSQGNPKLQIPNGLDRACFEFEIWDFLEIRVLGFEFLLPVAPKASSGQLCVSTGFEMLPNVPDSGS